MKRYITAFMLIGLALSVGASDVPKDLLGYRFSGFAGYIYDTYAVEIGEYYTSSRVSNNNGGGILGIRAAVFTGPLIDLSLRGWLRFISGKGLGIGFGLETEILSLIGVQFSREIDFSDPRWSGWVLGMSVPVARMRINQWEAAIIANASSLFEVTDSSIKNQFALSGFVEISWMSDFFIDRISYLSALADF